MPQFPPWKEQLAAWTDAAQLRRSQVRQAVAGVLDRGRSAAGTASEMARGMADQARDRAEALPRAVRDELLRRLNVLDLATRQDVERQARLARNRMSVVMREHLEQQRTHEAEMLATLRADLREELQSFAAAIGDDLLLIDDARTSAARKPGDDLDDFDDFDDDDLDDDFDDAIDLVTFVELDPKNDDDFDELDGGLPARPRRHGADGF